MMGYGYEPIIAIICTFRSLIPNFSRVIKDSMQARNLQFQYSQNSEDLHMYYAIGDLEHNGKQSFISEQ